MTNKSPEVGKRYINISKEIEDFWKNWEELPDSQKKPEVQLTQSIVLEVEKAKEELKEELRWWNAIILKYTEQMITQRDMAKVTNAAQKLIDALERQKVESTKD